MLTNFSDILLNNDFLTNLGIKIKKENCPFCGNRWIRRSDESPITCPECKRKFFSQEQLVEKRKNRK